MKNVYSTYEFNPTSRVCWVCIKVIRVRDPDLFTFNKTKNFLIITQTDDNDVRVG